MSLDTVLDLLRARIGLDPDSLGPAAFRAAVAARMRDLGLTDPAAYAGVVLAGGEECDALADEIVVPETWFFRGGAKLFADLARHLRDTLAAEPPDRTFRALSVPCSTGEEPYSLAIALTEAGIPPGRWTIDGIDLSRRSLERAGRGWYRESAFREGEPRHRHPYFRPVEGGWEIVPSLRGAVRFRRGNLVEPRALADEGPFDLVMCRNLLIYLHPAARAQVLATLDRLLAPCGLLCTGHAEPLSLLDRRFRPTGPPGFFLYRRDDGGSAQCPGLAPGRLTPASTPERLVSVDAPGLPRGDSRSGLPGPGSNNREAPRACPGAPNVGGNLPPVETNVTNPGASPGHPLAEARTLADAGKLDEALASCRAHLGAAGPSAELYSLLGAIHHARHERAEAANCFRKALYLDPAHAGALTHLMLLSEEDGDTAAADRLRRRLARATAGGEP
jgi:chemotaxis protein methyltransferase WspC